MHRLTRRALAPLVALFCVLCSPAAFAKMVLSDGTFASSPVLGNGLSTTPQTVWGTSGILTEYYCANPNASDAFVQIFDTTGAVTLGTTVPKWSIRIPAGAGANLAGLRLGFGAGIKVAATTTATGSTAPSSALDCNFGVW